MIIHERNINSLKSINILLTKIIKNPNNHINDTYINKSLKSQGGLASYKNDELNIFPCSLNSQKSVANETLDNGYSSLNDLRISALNAIKNASSPSTKINKSTKEGLKNKVTELENDITLLEQRNLLLSEFVLDLTQKIRLISTCNKEGLESELGFILKEVKEKNNFINRG